ncbi:amino acid transporter, partial [Aureobasidium melanogenum]
SPNYSSASFVFGDFINTTGWPDGLAWLLGLLQGGFGLTGFDAVAHMIEEIPNPRKTGPFVMITCVAIGTFTGFIFLMCLLFVAGDINQVIDSGAGPLLQILYNATSSHAGAICLLMFPLVCTVFATIAIMTTSSRMAWAFARDRGLPFSRFFAKVHPGLDVPVNALALTLGLVIIFGCIFLGSSSAFNAITSASVVALSITYAIPIACNVLQGRKGLPADRPFILPSWFGWFANLLGIAYVTLTSVLFLFPPELPVDANNMNYCIVAFGIWLFISLLTYIFDGRKNYTGPKVDIVDDHVLTASPSPEMTRTNNQMDYSEKGKESGF